MSMLRVIDVTEVTCPFRGDQIENVLTGNYSRLLQRARGISLAEPLPVPLEGAAWRLVDGVFGGNHLLFREVQGALRRYMAIDFLGVSGAAYGEATPAVIVTLTWGEEPADGRREAALRSEVVAVLGVYNEWLNS